MAIWHSLTVYKQTKTTLDELVNRNNKYVRAKTKAIRVGFLYLSIGIGFVYYFINEILSNYLQIFVNITGNPVFIILFLTFILASVFFRATTKERDRLEKKMDLLRIEVIDMLNDIWLREYGQEICEEIIKELEEANDINVSYRS